MTPTTAPTRGAVPERLHRCTRCGGSFPVARMVKARGTRTGVEPRCLDCVRARQRRSEFPDGVLATNYRVDQAPDRDPAVRLRCALERHRAAGRPLSSAWPAAMSEALRGLPAAEVVSWRQAFSATRAPWEAGYARAGDAHGLRISVADVAG